MGSSLERPKDTADPNKPFSKGIRAEDTLAK